MAKPKNATSLCLSDEARELLRRKAEEEGITKSAAMEQAIRWWASQLPKNRKK